MPKQFNQKSQSKKSYKKAKFKPKKHPPKRDRRESALRRVAKKSRRLVVRSFKVLVGLFRRSMFLHYFFAINSLLIGMGFLFGGSITGIAYDSPLTVVVCVVLGIAFVALAYTLSHKSRRL